MFLYLFEIVPKQTRGKKERVKVIEKEREKDTYTYKAMHLLKELVDDDTGKKGLGWGIGK